MLADVRKASCSTAATKQRQSSRKTSRSSKRKQSSGLKQLSISESFCQTNKNKTTDRISPASSSNLELPAKSSFDFKLTTVLPSDCDSVVTEYGNVNSPQSTPTKRSKTAAKTVPAKRKRNTGKAEPDITPSTSTTVTDQNHSLSSSQDEPSQLSSTPALAGRVRKKLQMPVISEATSTSTDTTVSDAVSLYM